MWSRKICYAYCDDILHVWECVRLPACYWLCIANVLSVNTGTLLAEKNTPSLSSFFQNIVLFSAPSSCTFVLVLLSSFYLSFYPLSQYSLSPPSLSLREMKVNSAYMLMKHNSVIIRLMCVRARACLRANAWQVICTIYPVIPKLHILISQANSSTKLSLDVINVIIQSVLNRTEKLFPVRRPATTELAHWTPNVGYPSSRRHTWSVNLCQTYPSVPM